MSRKKHNRNDKNKNNNNLPKTDLAVNGDSKASEVTTEMPEPKTASEASENLAERSETVENQGSESKMEECTEGIAAGSTVESTVESGNESTAESTAESTNEAVAESAAESASGSAADDMPESEAVDEQFVQSEDATYNPDDALSQENQMASELADGEYTQPVNEYNQPVNEYGQLVNEYGQPVDEYGQTINEYAQPVNEYAQPVNEYVQPVNEYGQPVNEYGQPINEYGQPVNEYGQLVNEYGQPIYEEMSDGYSEVNGDYVQSAYEGVTGDYGQPVAQYQQITDEYGQPVYENLSGEYIQTSEQYAETPDMMPGMPMMQSADQGMPMMQSTDQGMPMMQSADQGMPMMQGTDQGMPMMQGTDQGMPMMSDTARQGDLSGNGKEKNSGSKSGKNSKSKNKKSSKKNSKNSRNSIPIIDWVRKNSYVCIAVGGLILIIIVCVIILAAVKKNSGQSVSENIISLSDDSASENIIPDEPLKLNEYAEVNELINRYFEAVRDNNIETAKAIMDVADHIEQAKMSVKSTYVENYQDINCYTKPGPMDNSYIVYVTYNVKLFEWDILTPSLLTFLVCPREDGTLYIYNSSLDNNMAEYVRAISAQEDVVELVTRIDTEYREILDSNAEFRDYMSALNQQIKNKVGEIIAAENMVADDDSTSDNSAEGNGDSTFQIVTTSSAYIRASDSKEADIVDQVASGTTLTCYKQNPNGWFQIEYKGEICYISNEVASSLEAVDDSSAIGTVRTTDTVNVRSKASTDSTSLGVVYQGTDLKLIEKMDNGWSKVIYNNQEGYVKSEYLE